MRNSAYRFGNNDGFGPAGRATIIALILVFIEHDRTAIAPENYDGCFLCRQAGLVLVVMVFQTALVAAQTLFQMFHGNNPAAAIGIRPLT